MEQLSWQASLFDGGPPALDVSFDGLHRIQLDERSWVDYCPGWLRGSDSVFEELLRTGRWRQRELWMYDGKVREPRLTAGWTLGSDEQPVRTWGRYVRRDPGDADPGTVHGDQEEGRAEADDAATPEVLQRICSALSERYAVRFDSVWVNLYRDGRDSVAWHGDRNAKVLRNPMVATVSLGGRRRFQLRARGTSRVVHVLEPGHGDLVVMGGACQHDWEHCVPKTAKPVAARMSVTIRHSR